MRIDDDFERQLELCQRHDRVQRSGNDAATWGLVLVVVLAALVSCVALV